MSFFGFGALALLWLPPWLLLAPQSGSSSVDLSPSQMARNLRNTVEDESSMLLLHDLLGNDLMAAQSHQSCRIGGSEVELVMFLAVFLAFGNHLPIWRVG